MSTDTTNPIKMHPSAFRSTTPHSNLGGLKNNIDILVDLLFCIMIVAEEGIVGTVKLKFN